MPGVLRNVFANLCGKAWIAIVSLAVVPIYIRQLGMEAYGLIGFYFSLIAIFAVLDLGLGNALNRQLAQYSVQPGRGKDMRDLLRTLEIVYWIAGIVIGLATAALAPYIASHWIHPVQMTVESVEQALVLMGFAVAVQWPRALYSGGLMGIQRQVLLNVVSSASATALSVGGALIVWLLSPTVQAVLAWTIAIGLAETVATRLALQRCLPPAADPAVFSRRQLAAVWRFAAGVAGITVLAVALGQTDKVVLSKLLTLEAFGYYSLAWRVASAIYMLVSPVQSAFFPRLSQLAALGDAEQLARIYHRGSQIMAVTVLPVGVVLALFAGPILELWVRDPAVTANAGAILSILVPGMAINGLLNMPASLQLAFGWTRLGIMTNIVAVAVLVPVMVVASGRYGGLGAAWVWLALNCGYVIFMLPLMHRRLLRGHLGRWLLRDIGAPLAAALAVAGAWKLAFEVPASYAGMLGSLVLVSVLTALASILAASELRGAIAGRIFARAGA